MATAVAPAIAPPVLDRRPVKRGWRARYPGDFPTLGWGVLAWTYATLPSPLDEHAPFVFTDEQARRVLEMYRLDPETGARVYRRVHEEEAKGWGKSPEAAAIALAEFRGPVCPDGWDANGQPVGVPWGTRGRMPPWIQIAAVSEDQTQNTYGALYGLLTANDHQAARDMKVDEGRTRLYLRDQPSAFLEKVTASAGSREGQRLTHAVLDEPQLWTPANAGDRLARTILRNLAKTGGWAHFTGNSPVLGYDTVAELYGDPAPGALHLAHRLDVIPEPEWSDDQLLASLRKIYGDAIWVPQERILAEIRDPAHPWADSLRFFFNVRIDGSAETLFIPSRVWTDCSGDAVMRRDLPTYAVVTVAHDHRSAAIAVAQLQGDRLVLRVRSFPEGPLPEGELVDVADLEAYLRGLRRRYPAEVFGVRRWGAGRERPVVVVGPEVVYHGAFFEGSVQRLRPERLAFIDIADTTERLAPAAEALKGAALEGRLEHDGDPELARQVSRVMAVPAARGWKIQDAGPAARAAMVAAQRAVSAPRPPARTLRRTSSTPLALRRGLPA